MSRTGLLLLLALTFGQAYAAPVCQRTGRVKMTFQKVGNEVVLALPPLRKYEYVCVEGQKTWLQWFDN